MKFSLVLFTVVAIIGLAQAHEFPIQDLPGKGSLHDDIQEILDLVPIKKIKKITLDYIQHDSEVQAAFRYLITTTIIRDFTIDFEAIPEVINFLNYLQKEGIDIYLVINKINRTFDIDELIPPPVPYAYSAINRRIGGLKGLFKEIMKQFNYNDYITIYVRKMKTSPAFVGFVAQLKSDNFQQIVNKIFEIESFQTILKGLKRSGVNLRIVADIMFIVLDIDVPTQQSNYVSGYFKRTLKDELYDELYDFWKLIPFESYLNIVLKYFGEDQQVQNAIRFIYSFEFHTLIRNVEALQEHHALVIYLHKAGFNIIDYIQSFHMSVGMEDYVPPEGIENTFTSEIGVQNVDGGLKAMLKDIYDILPLTEIDDLHRQKLKTSKVFFQFIQMLKAEEMQKILAELSKHETYKELIRKSEEKGLLLKDMMKLSLRMIGLKIDDEFVLL